MENTRRRLGRNLKLMAHVTNKDSSQSGAAEGVANREPHTPGALHDRELVRKAQRGDKESFEELVRRHQNRVFAVARGILKRQEDVEDISQQVFAKAYFALKKFDQRSAFTTWLYKITVNECWDLLRKRKVEATSSTDGTKDSSSRRRTLNSTGSLG